MMKRSADALGSHVDLLENKIGCDVTFEVGPQKEKIYSHKLFLIARSSVFETMFQDRWTESTATGVSDSTVLSHNSSAIHLPDVDPVVFHNFLKFLYADILSVNSIEEVKPLLYLAEKYNVPKLTDKCKKILVSKLDVTCVVEIRSIALMYDLGSLDRLAFLMMAREFSSLMWDRSFESMKASDISNFVSSDGISVDEIDLFNALAKWAEEQCSKTCIEPTGENLRNILASGRILSRIRFPLMSPQEFRKFVIPKNILTSEEKLSIFEYISLDQEAKSSFDPQKNGLQFIRSERGRRPFGCGHGGTCRSGS